MDLSLQMSPIPLHHPASTMNIRLIGGNAMQDSETACRLNRLSAEAQLVGNWFDVQINYDEACGTWFHIERFPLPTGWNRATVDILVDIPHSSPGYPFVTPQWFWTNWDLVTSDGRLISHFFKIGQEQVDRIRWSKGYGHFYIPVQDWQPCSDCTLRTGDTLLKYLQMIAKMLQER